MRALYGKNKERCRAQITWMWLLSVSPQGGTHSPFFILFYCFFNWQKYICHLISTVTEHILLVYVSNVAGFKWFKNILSCFLLLVVISIILPPLRLSLGFPGGSVSKESACSAGNPGSIPGLGRPPGGGHGNPLQCSCLENAHGPRSLVGPWDWKELDMTEWLSTAQPGCIWMWIHSLLTLRNTCLSPVPLPDVTKLILTS